MNFPMLAFNDLQDLQKNKKTNPPSFLLWKLTLIWPWQGCCERRFFFPSEKGLEKHALICGKSTISFWWDFCFSTLSPWGLCIFLSVLVRLSSWIKKSCGLLERSVSVWDREIRSEWSNFRPSPREKNMIGRSSLINILLVKAWRFSVQL